MGLWYLTRCISTGAEWTERERKLSAAQRIGSIQAAKWKVTTQLTATADRNGPNKGLLSGHVWKSKPSATVWGDVGPNDKADGDPATERCWADKNEPELEFRGDVQTKWGMISSVSLSEALIKPGISPSLLRLFQAHLQEKYDRAVTKINQLKGERDELRGVVEAQSDEIASWVVFIIKVKCQSSLCDVFWPLTAVFFCVFIASVPKSEKQNGKCSKWKTASSFWR